jgi:hypothetical protein
MATAPLGADSARANPLNIFQSFDRATLANAVEVLVCVLDALDGDPDVEEDDPSGQRDEDGVNTGGTPTFGWGGPQAAGCPISDPDSAVDDEGCDDINDDREEECDLVPDYGIDQMECIPEKVVIASDRAAMRAQCERIRKTRCFARKRRYRDFRSGAERVEIAGYQLFADPVAPTRRQMLRRKRGVPRRPRA